MTIIVSQVMLKGEHLKVIKILSNLTSAIMDIIIFSFSCTVPA